MFFFKYLSLEISNMIIISLKTLIFIYNLFSKDIKNTVIWIRIMTELHNINSQNFNSFTVDLVIIIIKSKFFENI